jgi:hypothetical protein
MAKRRHLGSIYDSYPAKNFESWLLIVIFKIIMLFVSAFVWLGIFWVALTIVDFLNVNLLEQKSIPHMQMFRSMLGRSIYWGGVVLVGLYILFSKSGSRKKTKTANHGKFKGIYEANQR